MTSFPGLADLYDEDDDEEIATVIRSPTAMALDMLLDDEPEDDAPTCVASAPSELFRNFTTLPRRSAAPPLPKGRPSFDSDQPMTLAELKAAHQVALTHERIARVEAQRREQGVLRANWLRESRRQQILKAWIAFFLLILAGCLSVIGWQLQLRGLLL